MGWLETEYLEVQAHESRRPVLVLNTEQNRSQSPRSSDEIPITREGAKGGRKVEA